MGLIAIAMGMCTLTAVMELTFGHQVAFFCDVFLLKVVSQTFALGEMGRSLLSMSIDRGEYGWKQK
jgi:hypothetical protein